MAQHIPYLGTHLAVDWGTLWFLVLAVTIGCTLFFLAVGAASLISSYVSRLLFRRTIRNLGRDMSEGMRRGLGDE